jgi:methylenetetrahydrofolate dehydrogenase (NADP+)/methenyltetrahydrofolate cyclohydrolase
MVVSGKAIADSILANLISKVSILRARGITPTLAVILIGDNAASLSYIRQKQKACEKIGAKLTLAQLPKRTPRATLASAIAHYNNDASVHGLIVQRPVSIPAAEKILANIEPAKDVDGFIPHSPFEVPVARATITILEDIHRELRHAELVNIRFKPWFHHQSIAVIGRGETAGKPIASLLENYGASIRVIHSKTKHPEKILKNATVIVSCVGKRRIITDKNITTGVILISVGLSRDSEGKLHGDYEEKEIAPAASFYTPTPGGVGPVNVACLMQNLVEGATLASSK